jgi:hypothetical protein
MGFGITKKMMFITIRGEGMSIISGTIKFDKNEMRLCKDWEEVVLASSNEDGATYHFENFDQAVCELNKTNEHKG